MLRHLICCIGMCIGMCSYAAAPHMHLICCSYAAVLDCVIPATHTACSHHTMNTHFSHTLLSHTSLTQAGQEESAIRARLAGTDAEVTNQRNIDQMQFITAMMGHIGYKGTPWVLDGVFRSIDSDGDGEMTVG